MTRLVSFMLIWLATAASADGPTIIVPNGDSSTVTTACWLESRYFENLKAGVVDYCRGHLRYSPGAVDCYRFTDQVCSVLLPRTGEWSQRRFPGPSGIFPCPEGPEPPMCPRLR